ncbi:unnamed protein product [Closterium sp. Yama58-4]|nr:unnamed protein product [Closterium sp. Yama58-4]
MDQSEAKDAAATIAAPGTAGGDGTATDARVAADASSFGLPFILNYWKEFDLENARTSLDEQGLKIAENQEASSKNRRKLAESTRDFKKAAREEQSKLFGALLKAYQEEVDNLTKRAKFAEAAFLGVYQKLYEAPDPVPSLASAAEVAANAAELAAENRRMHAELEEFRSESAHLKNQQATVRRLEERNRQLEQQMEEKVKEMVAMKQHVLAEESQRSMETLKSREDALQEQLRAARETVSNMQRLHEMSQSQLFELKAQSEEERASKQGEVNLLTDEVERAQARLLALEREKEALKAQLQTAQPNEAAGNGESTDSSGAVGWEAAVRAKEAVIASLHQELHALEAAGAAEREEQRAEVKRLKALLQDQESSFATLRAELATRPTQRQWEDLRKQVKILQAVGYNAVEVDDWDEPGMSSNGPGSSSDLSAAADGDSVKGGGDGGVMRSSSGADIGKLEALLLEKNKRMEHELTQVKMRLSEREEECETANSKVAALDTTVAEQRALIGKLEDDILKGYGARDKHRAASVGSIASMPGAAGGSGSGSGGDGGGTGGSGGLVDDDSVLMVVCGQRDRFRQRMGELEEELRAERERSSKLAAEVERLKADNVKLYERMRYVQDYTSAGGGGDRPNNSRSRKSDIEAGPAADVESKYKKIYEETINPFAAFSTKEREQRVRDLGLRDRITLTSGKFLLSNKYARTFVFFYSIGLHILVALSMYRLSSLSHARIKFDEAELPSKHSLLTAALSIRMGSNVLSAHYFPPAHSANHNEPHTTPGNPACAAAPTLASTAVATDANSGGHDSTSQQQEARLKLPQSSPQQQSPSASPSFHHQPPLTDPSLQRLLLALTAFSEQEQQLVPQRREGESAAAAAAAGQDELIVREDTMGQAKGMTGAEEEAVRHQQGLGPEGKEGGEERLDEAPLLIREVQAERGGHSAAGVERESCVEEGRYYPFPPPQFRYAYPPPSAATIINIALALIATPRLYTQRPPSLAPLPPHPPPFRHPTPFSSTPFYPALSPFPPPAMHRPHPSPYHAPSSSHAPSPSHAHAPSLAPPPSQSASTSSHASPVSLQSTIPPSTAATAPPSSFLPATSPLETPSQPLRAPAAAAAAAAEAPAAAAAAAAPPPPSTPSNESPGLPQSIATASLIPARLESSQPLKAQSPIPAAPPATATAAAPPSTPFIASPVMPQSTATASSIPALLDPSQPLRAQSPVPAAPPAAPPRPSTPFDASPGMPRSILTASRPQSTAAAGSIPAQLESGVGGVSSRRDGGGGAVFLKARAKGERGEVEEEEEEEEGGEGGEWEEGEEKRLESAGVRRVVVGNGGGVAGRTMLMVKKRAPVLQLRPEKMKKPRASNSVVKLTGQENAMTVGGQKESDAVAEWEAEGQDVVGGRRQDGGGSGGKGGRCTDGHKDRRATDAEEQAATAEEGDVGGGERNKVGEKGGGREMTGTCSLADGGNVVEKGREGRTFEVPSKCSLADGGNVVEKFGEERREEGLRVVRDGEGLREAGVEGRATKEELRRQQLAREQLLECPAYRNYKRGEPSSTLYIKNIAKPVTTTDLLHIFG